LDWSAQADQWQILHHFAPFCQNKYCCLNDFSFDFAEIISILGNIHCTKLSDKNVEYDTLKEDTFAFSRIFGKIAKV